MKHVMIEYTLAPDGSLEELREAIATFVAGLRAHRVAGVRYTSFKREGEALSFCHVGQFPDAENLSAMQQMPFFGAFSGFLRPRCATGPTVTTLEVMASTESG